MIAPSVVRQYIQSQPVKLAGSLDAIRALLRSIENIRVFLSINMRRAAAALS